MALFDISQLAVDPKKSNEGVWVDLYGTGVEFLLARHNNRNAVNARLAADASMYKELRDAKGDDLDALQEKLRISQARVLADHVLLDWKGMEFEGETKYTPELAFRLLSNPAYEEVFQFVIRESINNEHFRLENEQEITEDVKPSANS